MSFHTSSIASGWTFGRPILELDPEARSFGVSLRELVERRHPPTEVFSLPSPCEGTPLRQRFSARMSVRGDSHPKNTPGVPVRPLTSATLKPLS